MKKLENKVAVITGGNSGIGLAAAKLFAANGAKVTITGRNADTVKQGAAEVGKGALGIVSDVSDLKNIDSLYATVSENFGKIDVLVINAGIVNFEPMATFTEEMFDKTSDTNFKGVYFSVQRALPYLNDGASVILTGSSGGETAMANVAAYGATKAAVRSLARSFSAELLGRKIRVNVLSPGPVETPIFGRYMTGQEVEETKKYLISMTPAGRLGNAEEIAEGFLYLASDDSRFMLGSELLIDGGYRTI